MNADLDPVLSTQFPIIPAPWTARAEAWWFVTSMGHRSEPSETLPISYFPPQETHLYKISGAQGAFCGGRGSVTLMRFTDTPIGPFDELAISPGEFTNPFMEPTHRITRAYASTVAAVANGRTNWGLPRELAHFVFTPSLDHPDAIEVRVYPTVGFSPVRFAEDACFAALIKPVSWVPSIPANLAHFPHVKLFQPPLVASDTAAHDGLVASSKWYFTECDKYKGHTKLFRCEGLFKHNEGPRGDDPDEEPEKRKIHKTGLADGIGFPDVEPYRFGVYWKDIELTLPQAMSQAERAL